MQDRWQSVEFICTFSRLIIEIIRPSSVLSISVARWESALKVSYFIQSMIFLYKGGTDLLWLTRGYNEDAGALRLWVYEVCFFLWDCKTVSSRPFTISLLIFFSLWCIRLKVNSVTLYSGKLHSNCSNWSLEYCIINVSILNTKSKSVSSGFHFYRVISMVCLLSTFLLWNLAH